jgi:hypothetical protein
MPPPPPAEELEVIGELVPGPPLLALAVAVLHDGGVFHEGDVPAPLHQAPEGARVPVIVLHCRPRVRFEFISILLTRRMNG